MKHGWTQDIEGYTKYHSYDALRMKWIVIELRYVKSTTDRIGRQVNQNEVFLKRVKRVNFWIVRESEFQQFIKRLEDEDTRHPGTKVSLNGDGSWDEEDGWWWVK